MLIVMLRCCRNSLALAARRRFSGGTNKPTLALRSAVTRHAANEAGWREGYGCCFSFTWPTESIIGIVVDNIRGAIKIIKTVQRKLREHQIVNDSIVEQRDQQPSLNGSYCLIVSAENKPLIITFNSLQRRSEKKNI